MSVEYDVTKLQARVRELEERLDFLYQALNITYAPSNSNRIDPRIIEALQKGDKIGAIKIYRDITGEGLAEAKSAIDALAVALS
ncbi:MAG: hypothetical protein LC099_10890 [Anaerolineales bacterium]|nr:hypothetical protein [Anaerolineales bacterium]